MKVYEKNRSERYYYPEEMERILSYLNEHGKVLVSGKTIENLYFDFSDERYCASWMGVNDQMLEEFEEYLEKIEI